jgi:5-carboxymethyl-2-hydroxymuconic-semialdehyde dehydrogenase
VGPLIHPEHRDRVLGYIEIGKQEGAKLLVGGERVGSEGNYVSPALFTGENHMRIAQEEIFGPVLTAIPFKSEADALAKANDVKYGLASYLWTSDVARAHRMALALEAGMTWINSHNVRHLPTPFGGVKSSGIGRDGGDWSFDFYMETKNVAFATGRHAIQKLGG